MISFQDGSHTSSPLPTVGSGVHSLYHQIVWHILPRQEMRHQYTRLQLRPWSRDSGSSPVSFLPICFHLPSYPVPIYKSLGHKAVLTYLCLPLGLSQKPLTLILNELSLLALSSVNPHRFNIIPLKTLFPCGQACLGYQN